MFSIWVVLTYISIFTFVFRMFINHHHSLIFISCSTCSHSAKQRCFAGGFGICFLQFLLLLQPAWIIWSLPVPYSSSDVDVILSVCRWTVIELMVSFRNLTDIVLEARSVQVEFSLSQKPFHNRWTQFREDIVFWELVTHLDHCDTTGMDPAVGTQGFGWLVPRDRLNPIGWGSWIHC